MTYNYAYHKEYYARNRAKKNLAARVYGRKYDLQRKQKVIEILGGKCVKCGYKEHQAALQIDHIIPLRRKTKGMGVGGNKNCRAVLKGHIENVQLLCANCHAIKTYEERVLKETVSNTTN